MRALTFDQIAVGEIKVYHAPAEVWGEGQCPLCQNTITGHVDLNAYAKEGIFFTMEQQKKIMAAAMNKHHKLKCTAMLVKPYDGRFNCLKKDHAGVLRVPEDIAAKIDARDLD